MTVYDINEVSIRCYEKELGDYETPNLRPRRYNDDLCAILESIKDQANNLWYLNGLYKASKDEGFGRVLANSIEKITNIKYQIGDNTYNTAEVKILFNDFKHSMIELETLYDQQSEVINARFTNINYFAAGLFMVTSSLISASIFARYYNQHNKLVEQICIPIAALLLYPGAITCDKWINNPSRTIDYVNDSVDAMIRLVGDLESSAVIA